MCPRDFSGELTKRLQEALDRLEKDITSIEILAGALRGFTQPVPDYEPNNKNLLRSRCQEIGARD
jgi:hypothetical protein